MTLIRTLSPEKFKHYLKSSRASRIDSICELECKFGNLKFDFSDIGNVGQCVICARNKGGNGKVEFLSGQNVIKHSIASKNPQYFSIELTGSELEIKRPPSSTGFIEIVGIDLHSTSIGQELVSSQWKDILSRCKEYKFIRISHGKLFAAEGAYIYCDTLNSIETNPPNMYLVNDGGVKFLGSCEILSLDVNGTPKNTGTNYFPHLQPPAQIVTPQPSIASTAPTVTHVVRPQGNKQLMPSQNNDIIYDSFASGHFTGIKSTGNVTVTDRVVKINHVGSISIPISAVLPNGNYTVAIESQKINGNGKISTWIHPLAQNQVLMFASPQLRVMNATLSSGPSPQAEAFNLIISRPPSATGEVVISRIMLLANKNIHVRAHQNQNSYNPVPYKHEPAIFTISDDFEIIHNDMDKVSGVYSMEPSVDKKFVVVIPSYKNIKWTDKCLESVFYQQSTNYRVIFIDDCSQDGTFDKAKEIVEKHGKADVSTLISNETRVGALANLYKAIHSCDDDEIVITLDGDDWFAHEKVLQKLQSVYSDPNVWLTYGQYKSYPDNGAGCSQQIPKHISDHNAFRQFRWCSSHLRTFYSWLFKKIKKEDLLDRSGSFYPMTWDLAFQFPMLEMGGPHCVFIPDVLYIYNVANPINDSKVNLGLQQSLEREIRAKTKYDRL